MFRFIYGVLFSVFGMAAGIAIFAGHIVSWLSLAVITILLSKGLFWLLMYAKRRPQDSMYSTGDTTAEFRLLGAGLLLSSLLFTVSGLRGEGWFGFVAAPTFALTGVGVFLAGRASNDQTAMSRKEANE
jgi:hypothetical protein